MPQPPNELFRTLADPTHRGIFERLCREGEQTVHALTDQAGVSQPAVSKHLGLLKLAGLVRDRREGRQTDYQRPAPGSGAPDRLDEPPRCLLTRPSRSPIEEDGPMTNSRRTRAPSSSSACRHIRPKDIWRAITQGPLIEKWLMNNDLQPLVGHRFNFRTTPMPHWNGVTDC